MQPQQRLRHFKVWQLSLDDAVICVCHLLFSMKMCSWHLSSSSKHYLRTIRNPGPYLNKQVQWHWTLIHSCSFVVFLYASKLTKLNKYLSFWTITLYYSEIYKWRLPSLRSARFSSLCQQSHPLYQYHSSASTSLKKLYCFTRGS